MKKNIKEQITIHKLKNICLIDWIQYEELAQKMKEADLLLGIFGTSEKATHVVPNKVFQALAMKKPILTSDTPAIREVFTPDEHIFISQSNPVQIADKIQHIYESEKMRISMAEKGYNYYNQNYYYCYSLHGKGGGINFRVLHCARTWFGTDLKIINSR